MRARQARALIAVAVVMTAGGGCSEGDVRTSPTTIDVSTETLPSLPTIRVATSEDIRTAIATEVMIGALSTSGAVIDRLPPSTDPTAALRSGEADLAVVATPPADPDALATTDGLVVMEPFPHAADDGELVPVLTATVSQRFGDLLEAVIATAVNATDGRTLDAMVDRVAGDGDAIDEVVTNHLAELGLVHTSTTTSR